MGGGQSGDGVTAASTAAGGGSFDTAYSLFANAKGNAFNDGNVIPFARGGVVNQPTLFNMGLMGEAGPEAVMPLARGADGKLGVKASGSSGGDTYSITIQVNADTGASKATGDMGNNGAALAGQLESAVMDVLLKQKRPGGMLAAA